jgi:hypothetical protein
MEFLIIALIVMVLMAQAATYRLLAIVEKEVLGMDKYPTSEEPKVTDPFQKPKEIYSSTQHIVVPKTPTEIRNQNFKKIKEGMEYGDIKRGE